MVDSHSECIPVGAWLALRDVVPLETCRRQSLTYVLSIRVHVIASRKENRTKSYAIEGFHFVCFVPVKNAGLVPSINVYATRGCKVFKLPGPLPGILKNFKKIKNLKNLKNLKSPPPETSRGKMDGSGGEEIWGNRF